MNEEIPFPYEYEATITYRNSILGNEYESVITVGSDALDMFYARITGAVQGATKSGAVVTDVTITRAPSPAMVG